MPDDDAPDENLTEAETQAYPVAEPQAPPSPPPPPPPRKLVRSRDDRVIAGVCGGLAEYLGVDSVLVRIAALLLVFAGGAGLILYLVGWIAMPEEPETEPIEGEAPEPPSAPSAAERTAGTLLLGLVFVALGVFFLVDEIWPDFFSWQYVWPIALIGIGLAVLVRARQ